MIPQKGNKDEKTSATDIVTYHIYWNSETEGKIEKHIPKEIKEEYKNKYKYVYHDKNGGEHDICIVDWHETIQKENGDKVFSMPIHSKIITDENINEGQTKRRIQYENGDIAEYGYNKGVRFWRLFICLKGKPKIELVHMPGSLNYNKSGVIIKYSFSNTKRRYTSPGALAGFIGALAECGYTDIITTGSCFKEATCFPSRAHVNGKSIDTLYLSREQETKFIKAMHKFKFDKQITGTSKDKYYEETKHMNDHNDHLHSGFNESAVKIIKEK